MLQPGILVEELRKILINVSEDIQYLVEVRTEHFPNLLGDLKLI
jgi:hypothetical protein